MKSDRVHLSDETLMFLLQEINAQNHFSNKLKRIFSGKQGSVIQDASGDSQSIKDPIGHLERCPRCLYDAWDAYLSMETLLDTRKMNTLPRLRLKMDALKSSFQAQLQSGFLLPVTLTPAVSVRSGDKDKKDPGYLTRAGYLAVLPSYENISLNFEVESEAHGLKFEISLKGDSSEVLVLSLYQGGKLIESQNLTKQNTKTDFFVHYDEIRKKTKILFTAKKQTDKNEHKVMELTI